MCKELHHKTKCGLCTSIIGQYFYTVYYESLYFFIEINFKETLKNAFQ